MLDYVNTIYLHHVDFDTELDWFVFFASNNGSYVGLRQTYDSISDFCSIVFNQIKLLQIDLPDCFDLCAIGSER